MTIAPETILAHELVGLSARVVDAPNDDLVGVAGRVVCETTNTLRIESAPGARVRVVPKAGTTFEFELPGDQHAVVDGDRLVSRPARRTQNNTGDTTWHSA